MINLTAHMHRLLGCLALLAIAGFSQVSPAAKPASPPAKKGAPGHSASSDAELEKKIRERFARSKIATNHFQISVQGGVATITGRTVSLGAGAHGVAATVAADDVVGALGADVADVTDPA